MERITAMTIDSDRLVAASPGAMVLWQRVDGRLSCMAISPSLADIDGTSVEGHLGRSPSDVLPEIGLQIEAAIDSVFDTGETCVIEPGGPTPASPMLERSFRAQYAPVFDQNREHVEFVIGLVEETTDLERSRARLRLLDQSGDLLVATLDARLALTRLGDLLVSILADFVVIRLLPFGGGLPDVFLVRHRDAAVEEQVRAVIERFALPPGSSIGPPSVIESGRPELIADFVSARSSFARSAEHEQALADLGIRSLMTVPLSVAGRQHGAITLGRIAHTSPFDEGDVSTMVEIARRAGMAIENTRVHGVIANLASAADALEQLDEGIVMVGPNGLVTRINAAAESQLGTKRHDVLGRSPAEINDCMRTMVDSAVDVTPGAPDSGTLPMPCPGHPEGRWISATRTSSSAGVVYTLHDVTDSYNLERLTNDFVATVSHELRTPLTVLQGAAQTLQDLDSALDADAKAVLLEEISVQSQRLARIVDEILMSRQLGTGAFAPRIGPVDVQELASAVVREFEQRAPDNITLYDETGDARIVAHADAEALRQVLVNLVDNAIRYSPGGGAVVVRVVARDDVVELEVSDEGIGIPFVDRKRVFDKFVRLDPQHRHVRSGSGLGLYVSREIVRRMGGDITISDALLRGTTVTVRLDR